MPRTTARFITTVLAGAGLCGAVLAASPGAQAAPLKTGGAACVAMSAGSVTGADGCAGAAIADLAGVPLALPGPAGAGAAILGVPFVPPIVPPVVVPPVPPIMPPLVPPIVPPIVPPVVPPVPPVIPPVPPVIPPVVPPAGAGALGVPAGAGLAAAPVPDGAPILDLSGLGGKGVPTGPAPAGGPASGQPILPGPTG